MINKAEIGDFLYIIIFVILMLAGVLEKMAKAKKQQQSRPPSSPQPYDDFEDVDGQPVPSQAPPQTLEELMRRMMQTSEARVEETFTDHPEEAQSLEIIPETPYFHYKPVVCPVTDQAEKEAFSLAPSEEEIKASGYREYEFDIRQAVIASEILNRKY